MRLRILGDCAIELEKGECTPTASHLFALILRLAADPGRVFQRSELIELLFADVPSDRAASHNLRQLLYQAKRRGAPIVTGGGAVSLAANVTSDVEDLLRDDPGLLTVDRVTLAILPSYSPSISNEWDSWIDGFREQYHSRLRLALLGAIAEARRGGRWSTIERRARQCLALDPLNESATFALAEALAQTGSKERAVATLNAYSHEVGASHPMLGLPATVLKRRIEAAPPLFDATSHRLPFITRDAPFAGLNDQWRLARGRLAQCSIIEGEPGSGKTRMLAEFGATVNIAGGNTVLAVRRSAPDRFRAFTLFADLIPKLLSLPGSAGCEPQLRPFLDRIAGDSAFGHEPTSPGEVDFIRSGIHRAIADLLDAVCGERATAILIDDSRAIDDSSLEVIRAVLAGTPSVRLHLVIVRHHADARSELSSLDARALYLEPLGVHESHTLVETFALSTGERLSDEARTWCVTVGSGNPAFLLLLAAQRLRSPTEPSVPLDIVTAVDRRVARLPPLTLVVLEACAVLGDHCDVLLLQEVIQLAPSDLMIALRELEREGLIGSIEDRLHLRSSLFRDRVVTCAAKSVLSLLHVRAARAIESRAPSASSHWRIAAHWRDAGQHSLARASLRSSWRASLSVGQPAAAEESIREFLSVTRDAAERISLYDELIEVAQIAGHHEITLKAISDRQQLHRSAGIPDARSEVLDLVRIDAQLSEHADPTAVERNLVDLLHSPTLDVPSKLRAARRLLMSADAFADRSRGEAVHREIESLACPDGPSRDLYSQCMLIYHCVFGDTDSARSIAESIVQQAAMAPPSWMHISGQMNASLALQLAGHRGAAAESLENCYVQAIALGAQAIGMHVAARLASFGLDDGDLTLATFWEAKAVSHLTAAPSLPLSPDYLSVRTDLALLRGDYSAAASYVDAMRERTTIYRTPRYEMALLSYQMRVAQFARQDVAASDVERLLAWHYQARSLGRHDDEVEVLWVALNEQGSGALASRLLSEYVTVHRREARPCRHMLRMRSSSDPFWEVFSVA